MNKRGQNHQTELVLSFLLLVLGLAFFAPIMATGNYNLALENFVKLFVPLVIIAFFIDLLRRFFR